ncbi:unnamed protein product [Orchesella dallaii]|uniref:Uncharacterized protein n=1 Tax=Orchesella dallaii TaxID=48710 RepID=A0ABP1QQE8_9HEXA
MASNRKVNMVKGDIESTGVAKKIVMYSRTDPTGEKFLRYLKYVTFLKKKFTGTGSQSPWKELKTQGALEGIMLSLKKLFVSEDVAKLTNVDEQANKKGANQNQNSTVKDICSMSLSVLSHSFALDYSIRSEAVKNGFISSLQQFIANFTKDTFIVFKHAEMLSRAVRCIANLSNDSHCRESVLRTGVAISILRILELVDEKMNSDTFKDATSGQSFVDKVVNKNLICSCIRAIRILTSDSKLTSNGRSHLLRFGSLVTVINTLTWDGNLSSDETFVLDVVRALNFLSVRIRSAPPDVVDTLIYNPEVCKIRRLIKIFEGSQPDGKLFTPVIKCLINFSANKEISDCIGSLRIFPIILEKLDVLNENYYHGKLNSIVP